MTKETFLSGLPPGFDLPDDADEVGQRVLREYGAMLVARGGAVPPPTVVLPDEAAVSRWQSSVETARVDFGDTSVELQTPAMNALLDARDEARAANVDITPRGANSARRTYAETVELWQSRVERGLVHWVDEGLLTDNGAGAINTLRLQDQVAEILELESDGIYFGADFSRSILSAVAAPGTSQHLSMLAFDVEEHEDPLVRFILSRHGWFQTVLYDEPHFTYLGVSEAELPSLGLTMIDIGGYTYWVPALT